MKKFTEHIPSPWWLNLSVSEKSDALHVAGQASSPDAELVGLYTKEVANTAWNIASRSNLKPTNQNTAGSTSVGGSGKRQYSTSTSQRVDTDMSLGSADSGELFGTAVKWLNVYQAF